MLRTRLKYLARSPFKRINEAISDIFSENIPFSLKIRIIFAIFKIHSKMN